LSSGGEPRGVAIGGRGAAVKVLCQNCKAAVEIAGGAGFNHTCPSCGTWLHSCVHCRFWSNGSCLETSAEKVADTEGKNFCDWFQARRSDSPDEKKKTGGKEAAEELWKKITKK